VIKAVVDSVSKTIGNPVLITLIIVNATVLLAIVALWYYRGEATDQLYIHILDACVPSREKA
jgi:hypothetical protein